MTRSEPIGVGFGTAGLGGDNFNAVTVALREGFRKFDTAEADLWYDQGTVGSALESFFGKRRAGVCDGDRAGEACPFTCAGEGLEVSTKIPPWDLTSAVDIRKNAEASREELVGFCGDKYPLDVYYIHAPHCWDSWHPRCKGAVEHLPLREAWMGMEAVVGIDRSAKRIGLSNVSPAELLDIIAFVRERQEKGATYPPPRMPDVLQAYADPLEPAKELRKICEEHGIEFVSYSTLGIQHQMRSGENPVLGNGKVVALAERHGRSAAEVVLSWAIQRNMSVIPRSSKEGHIKELANMLSGEPFLGESDLSIIDGLSLN